MANNITSYQFIENKINSMKESYPSLRNKSNDYVFSALAVKSNFYKNPALVVSEKEFDEMIVDGQYDGGVDFLLCDPNSETSDMIIGQSKYYQTIRNEDIMNAIMKMVLFYRDMQLGHYESVNEKVQSRFLSLFSEVGDESKIKFVFYTSAPQGRIKKDKLERKFKEEFSNLDSVELIILFGQDIQDEIIEAESRRPTVESGKIEIDEADNYLLYGDDAAIVNVSALSIKTLYAQHNTNLLSRNLRYHVAGRNIDRDIEDTIKNSPNTFWLKNNGITIICDEFTIDGKHVKLKNFSIVNGGQTSYMIHKSKVINQNYDFYLPCKIITISGENEDEKNAFSLMISKAANSQKAIKQIDLKANSPEQIRFSQTMRECGIFYQTKRGEVVPKDYKLAYLNTDLAEIGKLALAGYFQIPGTSRNKPSSLYEDKYYDLIFNGNQIQVAKICKELLYIDYYFRNVFLKRFDAETRKEPDAGIKITFAHNARTICIAFTAFVARYYQNNIKDENLQTIFNASKTDGFNQSTYDIFKNLEGVNGLFPDLFTDLEKYDKLLYRLFTLIINSGTGCYTMAQQYEESLNATNYLKRDKNYYGIIKFQWSIGLKMQIESIVKEIKSY